MSNFDLFFERIVEEDMQFIEALLGPTQDVVKPFNEYLDKEIEKRKKCEDNNKPYEVDWSKIDEFMEKYEEARKQSSQLLSKLNATSITEADEKENTPTQEEEPSTSSTTTTNGRPKRAAFREASQMINKQVNVKLNNKLRREDVSEEKTTSFVVDIKPEKQSAILKNNDDIKKNGMEEMPPPKSLPIKRRPNRRIKKEQLDMSVIHEDELTVDIVDIKQEKDTRNSDVVIQEPKISLIDLTISTTISSSTVTTTTITTTTTTTSTESNNDDDDSRRDTYVIDKIVKRTQSSEKRIRDVVLDDSVEKSLSKRPKSNTANNKDVNNKNNDTTSTHYDDANSNIENSDLINATFITGPSFKENTNKKLLNTTVVIQKNQQSPKIPDGLLTDDESDHEQQSKSNSKHVKSSKQVFSAFEQSPVKKKVEAFEKLNAPPVDLPVRVTRTKTKALEKQQQQLSVQKQQNLANNSTKLLPVNNVKEKAKLFTSPTPKSLQKTVKKTQTTSNNKTKLCETQQKENDPKEKRDARMQQIIEERRRKREEKELKAQQQREIIEREKLKQIEEQERLKEERYKRLLLEQAQRKQKQREEIERKRLLVKEKAQKQKEQIVEKPKYLTMPTPRLPTDDCYDSDEEQHRRIQIEIPNWCRDENLSRYQFTMIFCGEKIKNAFFSRQAQTVDLKDIFQTNNPRILKRTSSAHWTKPPKYSILPTHLEDSIECSEDSGED